jgi:hypothetical protein
MGCVPPLLSAVKFVTLRTPDAAFNQFISGIAVLFLITSVSGTLRVYPQGVARPTLVYGEV